MDMKKIFFAVLLFTTTNVFCQINIAPPQNFYRGGFGLIDNINNINLTEPTCQTDSVKWIVVDTLKVGNSSCTHNFVHSDETFVNPSYGCLAYHGLGCHCSMADRQRKSICELCGFHVYEIERVYQSNYKHIETPYEKLFKKQ